jgi:hypothetical protein
LAIVYKRKYSERISKKIDIFFTIENHVSVSLAETLSFLQGHLYVDPKYASLHKYYALSLYHKIRTMSQTPCPGILACMSYKDRLLVQDQITALAMLHATGLSLMLSTKRAAVV